MLTPFPSVPVSGKWSTVSHCLNFLKAFGGVSFSPWLLKLLKLLSIRPMAFSQVLLIPVHLTWLTIGSFQKFLSHIGSL